MNASVKRIALILIALVLLPILFFSTYELNSLSKSEEITNEIYSNQLEAILYSVNQYSEDVVSNWSRKVNQSITSDSIAVQGIRNFLNDNPAIHYVLITDFSSKGGKCLVGNKIHTEVEKVIGVLIDSALSRNATKIKRLFTYKRGGYSKMLPLDEYLPDGSKLLVFATDANDRQIGLLAVDPGMFVSQMLSPRLQSIAQQKFSISVFDTANNQSIFSTDTLSKTELQQKRKLWLFPTFSLAISQKGESIEKIVQKRTRINFVLIITVMLVLVVGVFLIIQYIRKELALTQMKSDFISNVSHEIRTPLALINLYIETLQMGRISSSEKIKEYYSIITQETNRLSAIVNRILNFSQIEANSRKYNLVECDLNELVAKVLLNYDFHFKSKGFVASNRFSEALPLVKADPEAVTEAVINLIDNAIKYSRDDKRIEIETSTEPGYAYIMVQDYGVGITIENQKRIFEKFFRVTSGEVHNTKGSGLGLSIVKHIMHAHNGYIHVESSLGIGSKFKLLFPLNSLK
jgi:two-component system, OmpR family, phosphate regulon sensor histidine kinase PhoR